MMEFAKSSWDHLFMDPNGVLACPTISAQAVLSLNQSSGTVPLFPAPAKDWEHWRDGEPSASRTPEKQAPSFRTPATSSAEAVPHDKFRSLELLLMEETKRTSGGVSNVYFSEPPAAFSSAMAFFHLDTRELVSFNDSFTRMVEFPVGILQKSGFRFDDFSSEMWAAQNKELAPELLASMKRLQDIMNSMRMRAAEFAQIDFSFVTGAGRYKTAALTLVAMGNEVMWLAQELSERRHSAPAASAAPARPTLNLSPVVPSGQIRGRSASFDTSAAPAPRTTPAEKKLVKIATRVKKPWDENLVKFSLKADRTKRRKVTAGAGAS
jgi:hypothetical protein